MTAKACSPHCGWKVNGTKKKQEWAGSQSSISGSAVMLLRLGFCLLGLPSGPNYNMSRLTHRFVFLLLLWTILCPLSLFPCRTSFSRCPTFCLKSLNVLPSSALCSASRPHFLGLHRVTCDSCPPYTFIKKKKKKQFAKENTLRFFLQPTKQGHSSV